MSSDPLNSYSRLPAASVHRGPAPRPTRSQKFLEYALFVVFGATIALAAVALYATSRPEHQRVPNHVAAGIQANRVNVLLIGTTTRTRNEAESVSIESLTMLSVQPTTGRAVLISIPRDLWIKVGRFGTRPLHAAYMVGNASGYPGAGVGLTVDTVERVVAQPIHAYARFDVGDLQKIVDSLGGVDVYVDQGVYEYRGRLRFHRGNQHFNGVRAIKYAHSPYVAGPARDRFAREARQRKVLAAMIEKAVQLGDLEVLTKSLGAKSATNLDREQIALLQSALAHGGAPQMMSFQPYVSVVDVTSVAYKGKAVTPIGGDFASLHRIAGSVFARM